MGCETSCELQPITKKSEPDQPAQDTQRKPKSSKPAAKVGKYGKGVSLAMFWLIGFWFLQHYFPLIYKTRFPCWCEAEVEKDTPEEYVTRNDQFNLKPEKAPRERGRGRARGRGRGRNGRGEGAGRGTENGGRGRGRGRNVSKNKAGQSADWDENTWWDETWQEGWGYEGEEWAQDGWGTPGYYWDSYAWQDGKQSLHNLAGQNEGTPKTSKVEKSKPESSKPESSKPATKRLKTEEELAESNAETKKPKKKAPAAPKRNAKKKQRKEVETERALSSTSSSKKRKKAEGQAEETETQEPDVSTSTSTDKKKKKRTAPQAAQASTEFMKKIKKYYKLFQDRDETAATDEIKNEMKSRLQCGKALTECRLNIYWQGPKCGVTSKSNKKDIAHFTFNDVEDITYMSSLALALKCAELFVTWVHNAGLYHV